MRYLVKPIPGHTIVNLDYKAQEIGIAAALSQDPQMMIDYATGDPYLAMGKLARRISPDGTKERTVKSGINSRHCRWVLIT